MRTPLVSLTLRIVSKQAFSFSNEQNTGNPTPNRSSITHLEVDLLEPWMSGLVEANTDGDVMAVHVHCSDVRYAVIQASSNKDRPERLVIAYQDEDCLCDLIAAPSIFGLGFASREEAIAYLKSIASDAAPSKQKPRITAMPHASRENPDLPSPNGHVKHRRIPRCFLQSAVVAVIALFYSKNIVSVMIRMALGASSY